MKNYYLLSIVFVSICSNYGTSKVLAGAGSGGGSIGTIWPQNNISYNCSANQEIVIENLNDTLSQPNEWHEQIAFSTDFQINAKKGDALWGGIVYGNSSAWQLTSEYSKEHDISLTNMHSVKPHFDNEDSMKQYMEKRANVQVVIDLTELKEPLAKVWVTLKGLSGSSRITQTITLGNDFTLEISNRHFTPVAKRVEIRKDLVIKCKAN